MQLILWYIDSETERCSLCIRRRHAFWCSLLFSWALVYASRLPGCHRTRHDFERFEPYIRCSQSGIGYYVHYCRYQPWRVVVRSAFLYLPNSARMSVSFVSASAVLNFFAAGIPYNACSSALFSGTCTLFGVFVTISLTSYRTIVTERFSDSSSPDIIFPFLFRLFNHIGSIGFLPSAILEWWSCWDTVVLW